ncbi:hypothetical protein [Candidatus Clostridium radicumherbarum]|uniref:Uncharacterized protein n=1 Tax=Candidatus Clostridium radicumherbarum TaxID=3381662 RepID=A0ABW8TUF4_9CLOT
MFGETGKSKKLLKLSAVLIGVLILSMLIHYCTTYGGEYVVTIYTKSGVDTNTLGLFDNEKVTKVQEGNKFYILMKNAPVDINGINNNDIKIQLTKKQFDDLIIPNKLIDGLPLYLRFKYNGIRGTNPKWTFISFTEYNPFRP